MQRAQNNNTLSKQRDRQHGADRRGVSSVLAMMFMVMFGSLAAAMAVVAQTNMKTADAGLKVSRAMSAAETGLAFATSRLASESRRFVVERGVVDAVFGERLWLGTWDGDDGNVVVSDPADYDLPFPSGSGLIHALYDVHQQVDGHVLPPGIEPGDDALPAIDEALGAVYSQLIPIRSDATYPYFQLKYELLADGRYIRVTSVGTDQGITRTLQIDLEMTKKIEYAVLSPNRIMIGKNVRIEGPLGSRYGIVSGELDSENGDPLVLRSDFYFLDTGTLDAKLDVLYSEIADHDVDGDNRLRPNHPLESQGLTGNPDLQDYDGDEYVDDFDLFMAHYDFNNDQKVVYDSGLAFDAGYGGLSEEFEDDLQLAELIDQAIPDRDGDGVISGYDTSLGYLDGVLDVNDMYSKVRGRLVFSVGESTWEEAHGESYTTVVQGPIRTELEQAPASFNVSDEELREITTAMFSGSQTWFDSESQTGASFGDLTSGQVQQNLNNTDGAAYIPAENGQWESVPLGSPNAYDHYQRPIYRNMTFTNVRIPMGNNGLFEDCTFIGVTFIETTEDCEDQNWNYVGAREPGPGGYVLRFPGLFASLGDDDEIDDTKPYSNNIRFHSCTFLGSVAGHQPTQYTHWRNKLQFTGNTRFYIDPEDTDLLEQSDAAELQAILTGIGEADLAELSKSSMLLPGWSSDVGNFSNDVLTKVKLKGTIVTGIMDVRGTADVFGTMLMTFRPESDSGPLSYGGLTDSFNTTIGYFGSTEGDGEGSNPGSEPEGYGAITIRYDPDAILPDGIPWPISCSPVPLTYVEGGSM